jgi:anti-anti-sigma factor
MTVTKDRSGEKLVILLEGRLDTTTASQLQAELIPEFDAAKEIQLDFKGLDYVSSAGLRVLLMGEKTAKAKDGKMILTNVSDDVLEVLEMTGLSDVLTIE